MLETRLDTIDFRPAFPFLRLALLCAAFGALGLLFALETRNAFTYGVPVTTGFIVERAAIASLLLPVFTSLLLWVLLPLRLRFTEAGLLRRTILRPRFVPWQAVARACLTSFKSNVMLELNITGRRLPVLVPLADYRRPAALLAQIQRRLPVEVQDPGRQLAARLKDD